MGEYSLVKIVKSTKPNKKLMAVFKNKKTGREKTVHFGDSSMSDYTRHKDTERKGRYQSRHKKDLATGDPTRAGFLSYYILWGKSTSLRENIAAYKRRFFSSSVKATSPTKKTSPKRKKQSSPTEMKKPRGLKRWFDEKWTDEKGNVCGSNKNNNTKKCRPSKRVTDKTPVTWNEMSTSQKRKAVAEKKEVGMGRKASPIRKKSKKSPKRMKSPVKKKGQKLCARGKAAAKAKYDVYPSAYANGYAVQVCKGTKPGLGGKKRKDFS